MQARLQNVWENVRGSLWFVPSVLVAGAMLLALGLGEIDLILARNRSNIGPFLFSGTADAARTVLSVIAGSLITVISIAFSITIVALQQASTQFSPRVLLTFTSSRANRLVLGMYTATFVFALLVLRTVRSETDSSDPFVPALSVTLTVILALTCLALLIYFIHHTSQSLQVSVIIDEVRHDVLHQFETLYPSQLGVGVADPPSFVEALDQLDRSGERVEIRSQQAGFVRRVDDESLLEAPLEAIDWLYIELQVGDFVPQGGVLAVMSGRGECDESLEARVRQAFVLDRERSVVQDAMFGVRQLVDIGLKALSPGINDPTTAEYVLAHLGDVLGQLAAREFPRNVRTAKNGSTRLLVNRPTWESYVDAAFSQMRREAASDYHVTETLLKVLRQLAGQVSSFERGEAVHRQVAEVRRSTEQQPWSLAERSAIWQLADEVDARLQREPQTAA